jgi:molecular chaperone DnaK
VPAASKAPIESALADLKKAHAAKDMGGIDKSLETLNAAWQVASQGMYQGAQDANTAEQTGNASSKKSDTVEDATYEEVK